LNPSAARAQEGGSSCRQCHEVEGKGRVKEQGDWHVQHDFGDMCAVCHLGNPQAAEQEAAHQGVLVNPLSNMAVACSTCHPGDYEALAEPYIAQVGVIEPEPPATDTPVPTPSAVLQPTDTGIAGIRTPTTDHKPPPADGLTATPEPSPTSTSQAAAQVQPSSSAGNPPAAQPGGWFGVMRFGRGPLFQAALLIFVVGMLFRLGQVLRLGWKRPSTPARKAGLSGVVGSFLKGVLVWPFIPWMRSAFRRSPLMYVAGGLFHLGLFAVIFFSKTHMMVWKELIGIGWPVLAKPVVSWLAAVAIIAMLALLVNRIIDPLLRRISGLGEWLNWIFVFLPMVTGFIMARRWWLPYEVMFSLHILLVDFLLVWIPFSRISHFLFYFLSRTIHGTEFGKQATFPLK